jgi:hypothetical protein
MPQFADLKRSLAAVTGAAQDARTRLQQVTGDMFSRMSEIPRNLREEVARRCNVLDLATRRDVEQQSRMARSRVSVVLRDFLDTQREHDEKLLEALRAEIREELETFATAISDELFAANEPTPARRTADLLDEIEALDDLEDFDDDDLGLDDDIDITAR